MNHRHLVLLVLLFTNLTANLVLGAATTLSPKNPKDLCERFISPDSLKECEARIKKIGPDWYLSTICDQQFDDADFWSCLELSKTSNFSPEKLETCNKDGAGDQEKLNCVRKLAKESIRDSGFQDASISGKSAPKKMKKK